jgi:hypothetical protein
MNFTPKFFKRGFFIFGIFNLILIGLIVFAPKHRPDHKMHLTHVVEKLNDILSLDSKQQAKLQVLFDQHQNEIDSIKKITLQNHKQFITCLNSKNGDCDSLVLIQPSFEMILFKHHQRILKILNSKQKEKYLIELKTEKPKGPPPF